MQRKTSLFLSALALSLWIAPPVIAQDHQEHQDHGEHPAEHQEHQEPEHGTEGHSTQGMEGMDMEGMHHDHGMHAMRGMLGAYSMSREASGTAWQPESTPHVGYHTSWNGWDLMTHGFANLV
ncbi:MAG: hypothetical protein ACJ76N_19715, partial [Thermoanaerobaculia bacterium]